jgi:hypothetical protein
MILGRTQVELAEAWWQWAYTFPRTSGPVADLTGAECGAGQKGFIWFLAGTCESRLIHRTCKLPFGKYLFFPVINYVVVDHENQGAAEALGCAHSKANVAGLVSPARD